MSRTKEQIAALNEVLPVGYDIGDDATSVLAVELVKARAELSRIRGLVEDRDALTVKLRAINYEWIDSDEDRYKFMADKLRTLLLPQLAEKEK